jgi:indolepyruvate ferredoxin oxidoreductase beta subunit
MKNRKTMNIYLIGVGGQGIGMLSEILLRAADHAGLKVMGVDTHGLAQRGGIVVSQLRFGDGVHSPLIRKGDADLVVALERHEAVRAAGPYLKDGGTLIYYDAEWQPLDVRLDPSSVTGEDCLKALSENQAIDLIKVFNDELESARMQNVVLVASICRHRLIPAIERTHYRQAMKDLMAGVVLDKNMALFEQEVDK